MTFEEALAGKEIPSEVRKNLSLINVFYFSFDGEVKEGQMVVHKEVADEVKKIFEKLLEARFPIQSIAPIVIYNWDDDASMSANNTSAFNYRLIFGTDRLLNHSYGRAIDINPIQNPYVRYDGAVVPFGASYDIRKDGTITAKIADVFKSFGWMWGGDWETQKDWQHFEKPETKV